MSKLKLNKKDILEEVSFIREVAAGEATSHLNKNILLIFKDNVLLMKAVNIFCSALSVSTIDSEENFHCAVDSDKLFNVLNQLNTETINLSYEKDRLTISAGRSRYVLMNNNSAASLLNFEVQEDTVDPIQFNADNFRKILNLGDRFVSKKDTTQFTMRSFFLDLENDTINLTSMEISRMVRGIFSDKLLTNPNKKRITVEGRNVDILLKSINTETIDLYDN